MADEQPGSGSEASIESRMDALFAPPAQDTPPEVAVDTEQQPAPELADSAQEPEDDLDDLDVDGTNYRVPKALKAKATEWQEANQRWGDYTRKTQEVADLHRHIATVAETYQMRQAFDQSTSEERAELSRVTADMARYKALDWTNLDIDSHVKLRTQLEQLKERAGELESGINSKARQLTQANETKRQEIIDHGTKYLSKVIPKWGAEAAGDVTKAGEVYGYSKAELNQTLDPRLMHVIHDAAQYRKLLASKEKALETVQKAPPIIKPGASKGQNAEVNQRFKDTRASLRKSGSLEDAARLIQMMSK
jgi:hypothetical protein